MNKIYVILTVFYDPFGKVMGYGFYNQQYEHRSTAVRRAKQLYGENNPRVDWTVLRVKPHLAMYLPCILDN